MPSLLANPVISGITLSGGEPFSQALGFSEIAGAASELGLSVVTYTGHTWEELVCSSVRGVKQLLAATDILVDGRFVESLRDLSLPYRGSRNQRLIDVKQSLACGTIVEFSV
jgi:anaerobic ribonucleoside-triphosphate reductase activating protein